MLFGLQASEWSSHLKTTRDADGELDKLRRDMSLLARTAPGLISAAVGHLSAERATLPLTRESVDDVSFDNTAIDDGASLKTTVVDHLRLRVLVAQRGM